MLVHVKEPRTEIEIHGTDPMRIVEALREHFELELQPEPDADQGLIPLAKSTWFQETQVTQGESLHIYRKNAHLTIQRLSETSGIPKGHLSAMEHDKRPIGRLMAKKLAASLGCDYRALL